MENHPLQLLQFIIKPRISYMENHHQIMENNNNNNSKAEVLKPIFLKAGIPLAITVVGFIFAKLTQRTRPITSNHVQVDSQSEKKHEEEGIESPSIVESNDSSEEEAEEDINHYSMGSSVHNSGAKINKYEIESSKSRVQELEDEMKHQELMLLELHNKFSNEITRVELFEREISALEAEMLRLESIGLDVYLKIVKLLEISELENGLLRKKVKKLLKRCKQLSHLIKEQSLNIEAKEMEIQRNHEQKLEVEANVRINMEAEIEELKTIVAELQNEKNELVNQIDLANKTISSKIEEEEAIKASYEQVVCETEQLGKERAMEAKELVYLRWCNACLRHELMRRNQEQLLRLNNGEEITDIRSDDEIDYSSRSEHTPHHRPPSKRVKIIQKLKRWMDKHERMVR